MNDHAPFLQAIRDDPDEDAPRLIYADWLDEQGESARAELIRLQVELARPHIEESRIEALTARELDLLDAHEGEWRGPLNELLRHTAPEEWYEPWLGRFRRGFCETLTSSARFFVERGEQLIQVTPLRHLRISELGEKIHDLARCPTLAHISLLDIEDYYRAPLTDDGMQALALSPYLGRLRGFRIFRAHLGDGGLRHLASAPWLATVRDLDLGEGGFSAEGMRRLVESPHLKGLYSLNLVSTPIGDEGLAALSAARPLQGMKTLRVGACNLSADGFRSLVEGTMFPSLTTLDVNYNLLGDEACAILLDAPSVPPLETLSLNGCGLGDRAITVLSRWEGLARLRTLSLNNNQIAEAGWNALLESPHLRQLRTLELRGNPLVAVVSPQSLARSMPALKTFNQ